MVHWYHLQNVNGVAKCISHCILENAQFYFLTKYVVLAIGQPCVQMTNRDHGIENDITCFKVLLTLILVTQYIPSHLHH